MTKIEEIGRMVAARTLHVTMRGGTVDDLVPSDDGPIPLWKLHTLGLRSMLQVLREPSLIMFCNGDAEILLALENRADDPPMATGTPAQKCWRAMIDTLIMEAP